MTSEELDKLEKMWVDGVPIKRIACELGYHVSTIDENVALDRERFPYRRNKIDYKKMDMWVERIRAGRATVAEAAHAMVVSKETVRKRLRGNRG